MKQRLSLARALVHDPEVLILDEPASGLDPRARIDLRTLLLTLREMGKTVLISSHILPELQEVCTDVAIIEAGRLLAAGPPRDILQRLGGARSVVVRLAGGEERRFTVADDIEQASLLRATRRRGARDRGVPPGGRRPRGPVPRHHEGGRACDRRTRPLNPVLARELRIRLRGRQGWILLTIYLVLLGRDRVPRLPG